MRLNTTVARCLGTALGLFLAATVGVAAGAELPGYAQSNYQLGYAPLLANTPNILSTTPNTGPVWEDLFTADGTAVPGALGRYTGARDAIFLQDNISNGVGIDMSNFTPSDAITDMVVNNGTVQAGHDLGNAYIYAVTNAEGHLVIYAAAERLGAANVDSYVDFEFNQGIVQVWAGVPWPMHGERTPGDVSVRVNFTQGVLTSVQARAWDADGSFHTLSTRDIAYGTSCDGEPGVYAVCNGVRTGTAAGSVREEVRDDTGQPVTIPDPDSLVQVGIDVTALLLGQDIDFTSIQVRTPQDVILGGFRKIGYWGRQGGTTP